MQTIQVRELPAFRLLSEMQKLEPPSSTENVGLHVINWTVMCVLLHITQSSKERCSTDRQGQFLGFPVHR